MLAHVFGVKAPFGPAQLHKEAAVCLSAEDRHWIKVCKMRGVFTLVVCFNGHTHTCIQPGRHARTHIASTSVDVAFDRASQGLQRELVRGTSRASRVAARSMQRLSQASRPRQHAVNKPQCVTDYARSAANVFSYQRLLLCASAAGTRWIQACGDARKYTSALRSTAEANKHLNALMSMFMHSRERVCVHTDVCMCAHRRFTLFRGGLHMQCLHLQTRVLKHCRTFSRGFLHSIA